MNLVALKKCMVYVTVTFTAWISRPQLMKVKEKRSESESHARFIKQLILRNRKSNTLKSKAACCT